LYKADQRENIAEIVGFPSIIPALWTKKGNRELFMEVNEHELKETLHSFQKDKSPGPDGWPIEFYIGFYDLLGVDLLHVVEESRRNGKMHAPFNSTFLALIPKKDEPLSFEEFRPISLCNCIYKIVAKIIARRLKPILSTLYQKNNLGS
jgi:hypothetical protein